MANGTHWIAVEGLDGCGKSTMVNLLADVLDAVVVNNPPHHMRDERKIADKLSNDERRAWYLSANREAARIAITTLEKGRSVVMDRSVASTLAFGDAENGQVTDCWPTDIPRPDLLVLLQVSESERRRRCNSRGKTPTKEERKLEKEDAFRNRILNGYIALGAIPIPSDGTERETLSEILKILNFYCCAP